MITITVSGFVNKAQAIEWLTQYQGSMEQHFDPQEVTDQDGYEFPSLCWMRKYIPEMKEFKENKDKENFNLELI